MPADQIVPALIERMNHLEDILVSSLLTVLMTGIGAVFTAAWTIRQTQHINLSPRTVFWVLNVVLLLIVGYYDFYLIHYCATAEGLISAIRATPDLAFVSAMWEYFRFPSLGGLIQSDYVRTFIGLIHVPLFPAYLCAACNIGLWTFEERNFESKTVSRIYLLVAITGHFVFTILMTACPFLRFLDFLTQGSG